MKAEVWQAIDRVRRAVDDQVGTVGMSAIKGINDGGIARCAQTCKALLAEVRKQLMAANEPDPDRIVLLLVCFIDERAHHRLPPDFREKWPWLQVEWLGSLTGGSAFFDVVESVLGQESGSLALLNVADYCLTQGFRGRYAGRAIALDSLRQTISAAIEARAPIQPVDSTSDLLTGLVPLRPWLTPVLYVVFFTVVGSLIGLYATWS